MYNEEFQPFSTYNLIEYTIKKMILKDLCVSCLKQMLSAFHLCVMGTMILHSIRFRAVPFHGIVQMRPRAL